MFYSTLETPIILLAFANDEVSSLRYLEQEKDGLCEIFKKAEKEGRCQLISLYPVTPAKIIQEFLENRGRIRALHYGGHSDADELFWHKDYPEQLGVKASTFAEFLATQPGLELVFLNGCLNLAQAKSYHQAGVRTVIATDQPIGDEAAQAFARLFYQSLAGRARIGEAFRTAESSFKIKRSDLWRGIVCRSENSNDILPWQIFPPENHSWRFPLATRRLTRIPSIDFEREFIGRKIDLERLRKLLDSSPRVVLVNGLGGIGKTVLATALVQSQGGNYDNIAWINRGEDLVESFALNEDLADNLNLPFEQEEDLNKRFGRILRTLQQIPGRNLLVIDNAQIKLADKAIREQLPGPPYWHVLLTSRLNLAGYEQMRLDTMTPETAKILFRTHFHGPHTEPELEELLEEIGYHTLTIELFARLLDKFNNVLSLQELTAILRQKQLDDPDLQEKVWINHAGEERGVFLHLMKAFELSHLDKKEKWLLKQFIVLPVEQYPVGKLADLLQEKPLGLNKILNSLASKGWLNLHEDKTFSIHRLIQQVAEYQLHPDFVGVETLVEVLTQRMSVDAYASRITIAVSWLKYATNVANFLNAEKHERMARLQNNIGLTFSDLGQYEEALRYHQKALAIGKSVLDINHLSLATYYNGIAITFNGLGQYKEALCYHRKALAIGEAVLDTNDLGLSAYYNNIAGTHNLLGQYKEALRYHQKALAIGEAVLDTNHPDLAGSYDNIATTNKDLGLYKESLHYHQKALTIWESVLDKNHPDLAGSYNNIANTYSDLGQYEESLRYHQKALMIWESVLETNHPYIATSYYNIANIYRGFGKYEEALRYHQKALAIREAVLNTNHPDLARSYNNIAYTYISFGKYEETLHYFQKALAIWESMLDAINHPDLATTYYNIAYTYLLRLKLKKAIRFFWKAMRIQRYQKREGIKE